MSYKQIIPTRDVRSVSRLRRHTTLESRYLEASELKASGNQVQEASKLGKHQAFDRMIFGLELTELLDKGLNLSAGTPFTGINLLEHALSGLCSLLACFLAKIDCKGKMADGTFRSYFNCCLKILANAFATEYVATFAHDRIVAFVQAQTANRH